MRVFLAYLDQLLSDGYYWWLYQSLVHSESLLQNYSHAFFSPVSQTQNVQEWSVNADVACEEQPASAVSKHKQNVRNQLDDWWPANGCNIRLKGNDTASDNTVFAVKDCTQQHLSFMSICLHGHSLLYHVLCFVVACGLTSPTINEHVRSTYKLLSRKKRNHRMTMATYKLQTFISSFIRKLEIFVCIFCIYDWCNKHSARSIHAPSSS